MIERIYWSANNNSITVKSNGESYTVKDTDGDGKISRSEINAMLRNKNLDNASEKLLDIFEEMANSDDKDGRTLTSLRKSFKNLSEDDDILKNTLEKRTAEKLAKETKAKELKEKYNCIKAAIKEYESSISMYKQQSAFAGMANPFMNCMPMMQSPANMMGANLFGMTDFGYPLYNSILSPTYGYPYGAMLPEYNMNTPQMFGQINPFTQYGMGGISREELNEAKNIIDKEIDNFKTELQEAGITEEELLNGEFDKIQVTLPEADKVVFEEIKSNSQQSQNNSETNDKTAQTTEEKVVKTSKKNTKKEAYDIAHTYAIEISDTVFDRDKVDVVKNKITKDNVLTVLAAFEKEAKDRDKIGFRPDGNPCTLWDGIVDEWSTVNYKHTMLKPIVDALNEKAEELGIDIIEDDDFRLFNQAFKDEYENKRFLHGTDFGHWHPIDACSNCDEGLVRKRFDAAYEKIKEAAQLEQ